jgi:3-phenylpropionate/trans-cinnamate dioxygenase ferredoxin subunit
MARHQICNEDEIPVGEKKPFTVGGEEVLVFHLEDGFFATQTKCTHVFWPLKNGKMKNDCEVECPFHRARFDVRTGEVVQWANFPPGAIQLLNLVRKRKALKTFPVTRQEGKVFVEV